MGILFLLSFFNVIAIAYASEPSHGRESTEKSVPIYFLWWIVGYDHIDSVADVQGHMVYDDSGNGGYENYAVFLYGRNTCDPSKVNVRIQVTALFETKVIAIPSGQVTTYTYWGPPPIDFVTWDGDMDYGATTPGTWQYTVGATAYGFNFGYTYTSAAYYNAYPNINPPVIEDIYRNMGYFSSIYDDGGHKFKACVRLQVHNTVATEWANGVVNYNPGVYYATTKILSIRVKVVFKYYESSTLRGTNSHILGDGINPDNNDIDINQIPLVVGSC